MSSLHASVLLYSKAFIYLFIFLPLTLKFHFNAVSFAEVKKAHIFPDFKILAANHPVVPLSLRILSQMFRPLFSLPFAQGKRKPEGKSQVAFLSCFSAYQGDVG